VRGTHRASGKSERLGVGLWNQREHRQRLVSEAQKALLHNRSSIRAHYWRDQSGVEIDLLLDLGSKLIPLECKAGKTVASDWFSLLLKYFGMAGDQVIRPMLVMVI
jgi:hypothetical protein